MTNMEVIHVKMNVDPFTSGIAMERFGENIERIK